MAVTSACTTDTVTDAVSSATGNGGQVNQEILDALSAVRARAAQQDGWSAMFKEQAAVLEDEFLRQCGVNSDGEHSEECRAALDAVPTRGEASPESPEKVLWRAAIKDDETGVLTGLYAAACTALPAPDPEVLNQLQQLPVLPSPVDAPQELNFEDGLPEAIGDLLDMVYAAIFASGVALAADAGSNRAMMTAIATRLRWLRDHLIDAFEQWEAPVPEPAAGYTVESAEQGALAEPTDSASAARYFHTALSPITQQLRHVATAVGEAPLAAFIQWCGMTARGEAALEPLFGVNPRQVASRGDA